MGILATLHPQGLPCRNATTCGAASDKIGVWFPLWMGVVEKHHSQEDTSLCLWLVMCISYNCMTYYHVCLIVGYKQYYGWIYVLFGEPALVQVHVQNSGCSLAMCHAESYFFFTCSMADCTKLNAVSSRA